MPKELINTIKLFFISILVKIEMVNNALRMKQNIYETIFYSQKFLFQCVLRFEENFTQKGKKD